MEQVAPGLARESRFVSASIEVHLSIRDVSFAYGGAKAVDECSFDVNRGSVTGLIGPNGAGKSTLIEMVAGTLRPASGSVVYEGVDVSRWGAPRRAQAGISRTFQTARVLPRLTVMENVMIAAQGQLGENPLRAMWWRRGWSSQESSLREEARELLAWLGLTEHSNSLAGTLSGGQRRLMEIARALMAHPRLLLFDEPTAGVYPEVSQMIGERVREIAARGVTVVVVAHNMAFLSKVADDVVCMAEGKVLTRGSLEYVRQHQDVISAYLGTAATARVAASGGT